MTPVRSRRGALIHLTADLRRTMCGRKADGWVVEPDAVETCIVCHANARTN
jgi:hypothetical protein